VGISATAHHDVAREGSQGGLGIDYWGPFYQVGYVALARSAALAGDTRKARSAYQDFFALWKDADPDIPILIEAKK
jgi:hypothetical protein